MADEANTSSTQDLEALKLREEIAATRALKAAEVEKTLAEAARIRADTHGTRQAWIAPWKKPAAWVALLPAAAALLTAIYGAANGYFTAYFSTQKDALNAQVLVLDANRIKLEAQKTLLEGQLELKQERLKDETRKLDEKRAEFESKRKEYDQQIADLKAEAERQRNAAREAVVKVPLDSLLNDELRAKNGYNENYNTLRAAFQGDADKGSVQQKVALILSAADKAKSPIVKAMLYRTLVLSTGDSAFLGKLKALIADQWADLARISDIVIYDSAWPDQARSELFTALVDVLGNAKRAEKWPSMLSISESLYALCNYNCTNVSNDGIKLTAATLTRDAILGNKSDDYYGQGPALLLIEQIRPLAGRLLFARALKLDNRARITPDDANGFLINIASRAEQPAANAKADWITWLAQHDSALTTVLNRPASEWPTKF